jgi:hypothetical protein
VQSNSVHPRSSSNAGGGDPVAMAGMDAEIQKLNSMLKIAKDDLGPSPFGAFKRPQRFFYVN